MHRQFVDKKISKKELRPVSFNGNGCYNFWENSQKLLEITQTHKIAFEKKLKKELRPVSFNGNGCGRATAEATSLYSIHTQSEIHLYRIECPINYVQAFTLQIIIYSFHTQRRDTSVENWPPHQSCVQAFTLYNYLISILPMTRKKIKQ